MLDFLRIENVAVAKSLEISFNNGFNVLTGETGAGKSIIIDSINMLLGAKISRDIIRHGEDHAVVSALFSDLDSNIYSLCDEYGIVYDKEDSFSINRTYTIEGKNTIRINSRPATLTQLKAIAPYLINIHGQNENQSFLNKNNHLSMLDDFLDLGDKLFSYRELYQKLNSIKSELGELIEKCKEKDTLVEILTFQIKEITAAKLKDPKEEEKLNELRKKLKSIESVVKYSSNVYRALLKSESGISAVVLIDKAIESLKRLSDVIGDADELISRLESYKYELEDVAERVFAYSDIDGIEDPERQLEIIEDRLALIQRLQKKYAPTIEGILEFRDEAEKKLKLLSGSQDRIDELKLEYKELYSKACVLAQEIHTIREKGAVRLSKKILSALEFLDMPKVRFEIYVIPVLRDNKHVLNANGFDDVEFMIATNVGEELSHMNKIASGGELARIMLALKSALTEKNGAGTVIFDEIDTGVSGSTSQKIGIKLASIASGTQTICVTHSAQIAALASYHYFIKKVVVDERAETHVSLLNEDGRVEEIARIIGGIDLTDKQFDAAKELIEQSRNLKDEI